MTFGDYEQKQFLPYIIRKLNKIAVKRFDVVWNTGTEQKVVKKVLSSVKELAHHFV